MRISFCTTCMNRLEHLSQTLPHNLKTYPDAEFVVLNYGSKDNLHHWIKDLVPRVSYYYYPEPTYFSASHAKNIAHKLAQGDILCNLDADNYLVDGFTEYLIDQFSKKENIIIASDSTDPWGHDGCCGKIAVRREHFYSVNGYDEGQYLGWGVDDTNFQFRARMFNNLELTICDKKFNSCVEHSNEERCKNFVIQDIHESLKQSWDRLHKIAETKDYIANRGKFWGKAIVQRNFQEWLDI